MCCAVLSCSAMSNSLQLHGLQPTRLLCPWGFSRQEHWSGLPCPPPGDLPNPGIKHSGLPHCRQIFLLSEPQGSPIILEWVAYPFSRGIFLTQEWNQGLLHCRQILYQLTSQGSSRNTIKQYKQKRNSHRFLTLQGILIQGVTRQEMKQKYW